MVAASLALMLLGSGDTLAASPIQAVAVVDLANHIVAIDGITTDAFENVLTGPGAWETRSLHPTTDMTRNSIDQTQWHVTTQLVDGDVQTNGAVHRAEWSTTTHDGAVVDSTFAGFYHGGSINRTQLIDPIGFISATIDITQATMPRTVAGDGTFLAAVGLDLLE